MHVALHVERISVVTSTVVTQYRLVVVVAAAAAAAVVVALAATGLCTWTLVFFCRRNAFL